MAVTKEKKAKILADLKEKFNSAKGVVFAQYRGLSVNSVQEMRRGLRAANVGYKVAKKTLVRLAAKEKGLEIPKEIMIGPIGVAFGFDDEIVAAQKMNEFAKKFEGVTLMGGIFEGRVVDAALIKQLAAIPSRKELIAKFMGSIMAPLRNFVYILNNVPGSFVRAVNAYQEKRAASEPAKAEAPAPAKVETVAIPVMVAKAEETVAKTVQSEPAKTEPVASQATQSEPPATQPSA